VHRLRSANIAVEGPDLRVNFECGPYLSHALHPLLRFEDICRFYNLSFRRRRRRRRRREALLWWNRRQRRRWWWRRRRRSGHHVSLRRLGRLFFFMVERNKEIANETRCGQFRSCRSVYLDVHARVKYPSTPPTPNDNVHPNATHQRRRGRWGHRHPPPEGRHHHPVMMH
jgi:hypothetical protein